MRFFECILTFCSLHALVSANKGLIGLPQFRERHAKQTREPFRPTTRDNDASTPIVERRASKFLNSKSKQFAVDGTSLPDVDFDAGESYAGVLPISDDPNETRKLYFWFFPSTSSLATDEITIWLQGGPGGASTGGLLLENGPILFQPGTAKPIRNNYSWNNLTNMVWIDQPVGTGFSVGTANVTNEYQVADQFMGFWKNFVSTFNMEGWKMYITGESYAGYYIPYIANGFVDAKDTKYFNLKGTAINDPIIGNAVIQFEGVAMQYLETWAQAFGLDSATMAKLSAQNSKCGYDKYLDKYFKFPPPPAPFPGPFGNANFGVNIPNDCNIQGDIIEAITALNPCFNEDHIFDTCPVLYDPLGPGLFAIQPAGPKVYYDREDVRKAIHAPANVSWSLISHENVFVGKNKPWEVAYGDESFPPASIGIVSKVIEATNNVIVGVGGLDFQLPANGTLLVFQNMTWNGGQGFSTYPNKTLYVPKHSIPRGSNSMSGYGDLGVWTAERGLTFYVNAKAGHEGAWYQPGVLYRVIQTMLGRIPDLSSTTDF